MARRMRVNGRLEKVLGTLIELLDGPEPDAEQVRLKFNNAVAMATSPVLSALLGAERWATMQRILHPQPVATRGKAA